MAVMESRRSLVAVYHQISLDDDDDDDDDDHEMMMIMTMMMMMMMMMMMINDHFHSFDGNCLVINLFMIINDA